MMEEGTTVMMGAVMDAVISAVMMQGDTFVMIVVHPRVGVAVVGLPHPMSTPSVKSARNMVIPQTSAGGATLTVTVMMMMTLTPVRRAPMVLIRTGTWIVVLLII
jgi:hypothetical protein